MTPFSRTPTASAPWTVAIVGRGNIGPTHDPAYAADGAAGPRETPDRRG